MQEAQPPPAEKPKEPYLTLRQAKDLFSQSPHLEIIGPEELAQAGKTMAEFRNDHQTVTFGEYDETMSLGMTGTEMRSLLIKIGNMKEDNKLDMGAKLKLVYVPSTARVGETEIALSTRGMAELVDEYTDRGFRAVNSTVQLRNIPSSADAPSSSKWVAVLSDVSTDIKGDKPQSLTEHMQRKIGELRSDSTTLAGQELSPSDLRDAYWLRFIREQLSPGNRDTRIVLTGTSAVTSGNGVAALWWNNEGIYFQDLPDVSNFEAVTKLRQTTSADAKIVMDVEIATAQQKVTAEMISGAGITSEGVHSATVGEPGEQPEVLAPAEPPELAHASAETAIPGEIIEEIDPSLFWETRRRPVHGTPLVDNLLEMTAQGKTSDTDLIPYLDDLTIVQRAVIQRMLRLGRGDLMRGNGLNEAGLMAIMPQTYEEAVFVTSEPWSSLNTKFAKRISELLLREQEIRAGFARTRRLEEATKITNKDDNNGGIFGRLGSFFGRKSKS